MSNNKTEQQKLKEKLKKKRFDSAKMTYLNEVLSSKKRYISSTESFYNYGHEYLSTKLVGKWSFKTKTRNVISLEIAKNPTDIKCVYMGLTGKVELYTSAEDFLASRGDIYSRFSKKDKDGEKFFFVLGFHVEKEEISNLDKMEIKKVEAWQEICFNVIFYKKYEEFYNAKDRKMRAAKTDFLKITIFDTSGSLIHSTDDNKTVLYLVKT